MRCVFSTGFAGQTGLLSKMEQGKAEYVSRSVSVKIYHFWVLVNCCGLSYAICSCFINRAMAKCADSHDDTRRQVLQMLSMLLPASAAGFMSEGAQVAFDKELVCVHIFQPGFKIHDPLLERHKRIPGRESPSDLFNLKIPEWDQSLTLAINHRSRFGD